MNYAEANGLKPYRYERPEHGSFGVLDRVGGRPVCHVCGRDFGRLDTHAWQSHGLRADEYRSTFELDPLELLVSDSVSRKFSACSRQPRHSEWRRRLRDSLLSSQAAHVAADAMRVPHTNTPKLTAEDKSDIVRRWQAGERQVVIARDFGVTQTMVSRVIHEALAA